jgi:hydrogenase expression/formation protein HypE
VVAIVDEAEAETALQRWQALPEGESTALIGRVTEGEPLVVIETELGGSRILEELEDDPLPRIC